MVRRCLNRLAWGAVLLLGLALHARPRPRPRSISRSCSPSTSPTRWTPRSRRCSARASPRPSGRRWSTTRSGAACSGRIAVTYMEWAGAYDQQVVVPWTILDNPESIMAFADRIAGDAPAPGAAHLDLRRDRFRREAPRRERRRGDPPGDRRVRRRAEQPGPPGDAGPRRGGGQGHHHQRPADHAAAAGLSRYPRARRLLPGLRHRRPGRLHGAGARARPVPRRRSRPRSCSRSRARGRRRRISCTERKGTSRANCLVGETQWRDRMGN